VLDCSGAGALIPHLVDNASEQDLFSGPGLGSSGPAAGVPSTANPEQAAIIFASCRSSETLPMGPQYPADIFTACLTTPIQMALKWFILQVCWIFFCRDFLHYFKWEDSPRRECFKVSLFCA
jgi:regulatory associated protein of mTOR